VCCFDVHMYYCDAGVSYCVGCEFYQDDSVPCLKLDLQHICCILSGLEEHWKQIEQEPHHNAKASKSSTKNLPGYHLV
jgi:hypothetical protein